MSVAGTVVASVGIIGMGLTWRFFRRPGAPESQGSGLVWQHLTPTGQLLHLLAMLAFFAGAFMLR